MAPDLLAQVLTDQCYYYMFNGCNNLTRIKCLAHNVVEHTNHGEFGIWLPDSNDGKERIFIRNDDENWNNAVPTCWTIVNVSTIN